MPNINNIDWFYFTLFLFLLVLIFLLEAFISQGHYLLTGKKFRQHHFSIIRYLYLLLPPLVAFFYLLNNIGLPILKVFFIFAIMGTLLEGIVGFAYHMVVGKRLWTYSLHSLGGYTSFLAIPYWGFVGVLAWFIVRLAS